ncbi:MAG: tRNA (adenosine(37)-N6)-threonylcarbamoyltransferase complex ATPase subunit type 1 TsaE [Syntrophobacterales bacterium]|nr:tRNA (adenosine(37)-N6)-threonylcarbamoyltransferase complex ATPase subunit type 1 TsaE [Syntrophobacterales bacterium]
MHDERKKSTLTLVSEKPGDTLNIGKIIGSKLQKGNVVALTGELGSGKTCITQGIARGLGVPENYFITSPTFTLINEYHGRVPLYHLDVYRLSGSPDLNDIGYEEYFYGDGVVVIEWAEKIIDILPAESMFIYLRYLDDNSREIKIIGKANNTSEIFEELRKGVSL